MEGQTVRGEIWGEKPDMIEMAAGCAKYDADKPRARPGTTGHYRGRGYFTRITGPGSTGDPDNWRNVEPERYVAALMRHLCKFLRNPRGVDEESGIPHLFHMACNIAFLVEMYMEAMKEE